MIRDKKLSGPALSAVGVYTIVASQYFLHIFLTNTLDLHDYGLLAFFLTFVALCGVILQLGLSHSVVRFIGEYQAKNDFEGEKGIIFCGTTIIIIFGYTFHSTILIIDYYTHYFDPQFNNYFNLIVQYSVFLPIYVLILFFQNVARAYKRMLLSSLPIACVPVFSCLFFWVVEKKEVEVFLMCFGFSTVLSCLIIFFILFLSRDFANLKNKPFKMDFKKWTEASKYMLLSVSSNQILQKGDILILAIFMKPEVIGIYSVGSKLAQVVAVANMSFTRYWAVIFSKAFYKRDKQSLIHDVRFCARSTFAATIFLSIVLGLFGTKVLSIFGVDYIIAYPIMLILIVGHMVSSFFSPSITLLQMTGHEKNVFKLYSISVIILLIVLSLVVPIYGIFGAAVVNSCIIIFISLFTTRACVLEVNCYPGAFGYAK
jgi:O-antigen/teichoic acid export membrane protein